MFENTRTRLVLGVVMTCAVVVVTGCVIAVTRNEHDSESFDSYCDLLTADAKQLKYSPERLERFKRAYGKFDTMSERQQRATTRAFTRGSPQDHEIFAQCYEQSDSVKRFLDKTSGKKRGYHRFGKELAKKEPRKLRQYRSLIPWVIGDGQDNFSEGDDLVLYLHHVLVTRAQEAIARAFAEGKTP